MSKEWEEIKRVLVRERLLEASAINRGASPQEIAELEDHIGVGLPARMKEFLMAHDGQSYDGYAFYRGGVLLSTSGIKFQWDMWRAIEADEDADLEDFSSEPPECIKLMYSNPKWIPITHDNSGNYVGLDFDPDVRGRQGQVVTFGRDEDEKRVLADSYEAFLEVMLNDITASQWVDAEHLRSASR